MIQPTLLFGAMLSVVNAAIYYYVGRVLNRRRSGSTDARLAWSLFVVWWYALAAATLTGAILNLLGAFGIAGLALFTTFTLVNLLVTCIALYSLMYYLLYLFTGNRRLIGPLTVFYIAYYISLVYYVQASVPTSVAVEPWRVTLVYQSQIQSPLIIFLLVLLLFPQIIGSLAYFTLYFRVENITQKYRILLVSSSIIIWFLSAFLVNIAGLSQLGWWQVLSRLISLSAALTILFAYQPPTLIKRRFGVTSIADESA